MSPTIALTSPLPRNPIHCLRRLSKSNQPPFANSPYPLRSTSEPYAAAALCLVNRPEMSSALDLSLDDLIKSNKKPGGGGGRGRGRGSGAGPSRRVSNRSANRPAPYSVGKAPDSTWQHDMYATQAGVFPAPAARASSIETGTKLYISNLEYGVSNEDIKELFLEVGDLKRYSINYDRSGRSKGTAEVVFARKADALAAVKRYNNVLLDGKPMKIEIIGTNVPAQPAVPIARVPNVPSGNPNGASKSAGPGRGSTGLPRGGGGGGGGRGRGRSRGRGKAREEPISAAALDADLEKYHSEAMQTN